MTAVAAVAARSVQPGLHWLLCNPITAAVRRRRRRRRRRRHRTSGPAAAAALVVTADLVTAELAGQRLDLHFATATTTSPATKRL